MVASSVAINRTMWCNLPSCVSNNANESDHTTQAPYEDEKDIMEHLNDKTNDCSSIHLSTAADLQSLPLLPHFFIVGAQRSGTTLLRLILNKHPDIGIPEESSFLFPYLKRKILMGDRPVSYKRKRVFFEYVLNDPQFAKWNIRIDPAEMLKRPEVTFRELIGFLYKSFCAKHGKSICGDKSPKFIRRLNTIVECYPASKFIHIVRDGRDTYLSLRRKEYALSRSIAVAAVEWRTKISLVNRFLSRCPQRTITIRYEDLISDPAAVIREVCDFLGVTYMETMLSFWKDAERYIEKEHSELIFRPIDAANQKKWLHELSSNDLKCYEALAGTTLKQYGYSSDMGDKLSGKEKLIVYFELLKNLPFRLAKMMKISIFMTISSRLGLRMSSRYY